MTCLTGCFGCSTPSRKMCGRLMFSATSPKPRNGWMKLWENKVFPKKSPTAKKPEAKVLHLENKGHLPFWHPKTQDHKVRSFLIMKNAGGCFCSLEDKAGQNFRRDQTRRFSTRRFTSSQLTLSMKASTYFAAAAP